MELIQKYLYPSTYEKFQKNVFNEPVKFMTATDIAGFIQIKSGGSIKPIAANVGKALTMLGFDRDTKYSTDEKMSFKGYYVREVTNDDTDEDQ